MKKVSFTPDGLSDVFVKRWMMRDMANSFIRHLKPVPYPDVSHSIFRRTVGFCVAIPELAESEK